MKVFALGACYIAAVSAFGPGGMQMLPDLEGQGALPETRGGGAAYGGGGGAGYFYCPQGNTNAWGGVGDYCIRNDLYYCSSPGAPAQLKQTCGYSGCIVAPPGQPDRCGTGGGGGSPQCYQHYDCGSNCCYNGRCENSNRCSGGGSNKCYNNYECGSNCCYNNRCENTNMCQGGNQKECNRIYDCDGCLRTNGRCLWDANSAQCKREDQCNYKTRGGTAAYGGGSQQSQVCLQYTNQCYSAQCYTYYDRYSCENARGFDCVWMNGQCGAALEGNQPWNG